VRGINPAAPQATDRQPERAQLDRAGKSELVGALGEVFKATKVVVVAHYSGLTVAQMQHLRRPGVGVVMTCLTALTSGGRREPDLPARAEASVGWLNGP